MSNDENQSLDLSFFKAMCDSSPFAVSVYDSDMKCVYFNKQATEIFNFDPKNTLGKTLKEIVPGIEKTDRYAKYLETLETGKTNDIYFCAKNRKDGERTTCYDLKAAKIEGKLVVIVEDVTDESDLYHRKDTKLTSLLRNLPAQIFFKNRDYVYLEVNKACSDFHELNYDEVIGKNDYELFDSNIADRIRAEDEKVIKKGITFENVERPIVSASGNTIWVSTTKVPLKDVHGNIEGLMGISFDITDRKTVESEVELLIATIHQTSEAIVITDHDGVIQYVNPAFEKVTGYSIEDAVGEKPSLLKSGSHENAFYDVLWKTITRGESWSGHMINKRKDGTLYEEDATISPVRNLDGEITNFVGLKKDVTNEKKLEEQLMQSQKMEAIGRLAGGVAHDFNNILTAILGYSELLLMGMDDSDSRKSKVEEINKAGKRAADLTKQMLAFSKKQIIDHRPLDVNEVINEMMAMLRRIISENIKLEINLDENIDDIKSDRGQIEQILLNLMVNARDAMPKKEGIVKITTENISREIEFKDGNFDAPPGDYVRILIQDNGHGMGEETIDQIFEPFFTRNKKSGTGLGLSTVYGIVKQHDGFIEVFSKLNEGTTFHIYLPASKEDSDSNEETLHGDLQSGLFEGDVLLVEDEPPVLNLAASILELNGFNVSTAQNGEDALEIFDSGKNDFKLLVTDVILPGITGKEVADKLYNEKPDLKILFMSGYAGDSLDGLDIDSQVVNFLPKPFSIESFSEKLREVMGVPLTPED